MITPRRRPDEPIARGNTSDIFAWTEATVVKVLRPDIPRQWASIEADITRRVHAAGLPVPATEGVVEVEGRPGVVLERIGGPTMWQRMRESPTEVPRLIDLLAGLQSELHATSVRGLPDLARRLGSKIDEAVQVSASERQEAQALLSTMPHGTALCHGDFHPANIVVAGRGLVILDWFDAATGHPAADHVRSSLLMRPPADGAAQPVHLDGASSGFLEWVHAIYMEALARRNLIGADTFARWEAVVAVARMSEPVPSDVLVELWWHWRAEGPGAAAALIERCLERAAQPGVVSPA
jgi:aminoglycoside phosphotransferase (APT) family kinase protein